MRLTITGGMCIHPDFITLNTLKHKTARNFLLAMEDLHVKTSIVVGHISPVVQLSDSGQSLGVSPR